MTICRIKLGGSEEGLCYRSVQSSHPSLRIIRNDGLANDGPLLPGKPVAADMSLPDSSHSRGARSTGYVNENLQVAPVKGITRDLSPAS